MKIWNPILIGTLALLVGSTGCKKYEDDPAFSLRSKKERVSNTWKVSEATDNGQNVISSFDQYELQMTSDGDARLVALYSLGSLSFEFETNGTWNFENNNEDIKLDFENDAADANYQILKLKEEELWLREKGGDLELKLVPR